MKSLLLFLLTIPALASVKTTFSDGSQPVNVGEVDPSFNLSHRPNGKINDILVLENGRIIVGGEFTKCGEVDQPYIAMFEDDGAFVPSFAPKFDAKVNTLAETLSHPVSSTPKVTILAGGAFLTINGTPQRGIAYLEDDGSHIQFELPFGFDGEVHAILTERDSNPLIGGSFSNFFVDDFTLPASNLANLYLDAGFGFSFDVTDYQANGPVYTLEDGDPTHIGSSYVWVGGAFTTLGGQNTPYLTQIFNGTGGNQLSSPVGPLDGPVREIVSFGFSAEHLVVRGEFTNFAEETAGDIVFIDTSSPSKQSRNITPRTLPASPVTTIARGIDGQLWLGHANGEISQYNLETDQSNLAVWNRNFHVISNSIPGTAPLSSSLADGYRDQYDYQRKYRFGLNTYQASATGSLVRLHGLHGNTVPPAPSISVATRPAQLQAILPRGLSLLEVQCQISNDQGLNWSPLNPDLAYSANNLFPDHEYQVRARYRNSNGFGPYSPVISVSTPPNDSSQSPLLPLLTPKENAPSSIYQIYKSSNNQVIVHGSFESPESRRPVVGFGLFDEQLRLVSLNTSLAVHGSNRPSFAPLPEGGGIYVSQFSGNGDAIVEVLKLNPDLSLDPTFEPISLPPFSTVSLSHNPSTNQIIVADLDHTISPILRIRLFDDAESTLTRTVELDYKGFPSTIFISESGAITLDGSFLNLEKFPDQTFSRIAIAEDDSVLPINYSNLPGMEKSFPLFITDQKKNSYYINQPFPPDDPLNPKSTLKRINAEGHLDPHFEVSFADIRSSGIAGPSLICSTDDGKLLIQGRFSHCNGELTPGFVCLNLDGTIDRNFILPLFSDPFITTEAGCVTLSDGSIVAASIERNGASDSLVRLRGSSTLDHRYVWASAHGFQSFLPNADPDNDGLTQQIEFLYGLDPNKPDNFNPITFSQENGAIVTKITPPLFPLGLPEFEISPDLKTWQASPLQPDFTLPSSSNRSFFRVKN